MPDLTPPATPSHRPAHPIERRPFGTLPDGREVQEHLLDNGAGLRLRVINLGGIVTALEVPDRHGRRANVVLGFSGLADYVARNPYFGALIGRYANRIAGARFLLDGVEHTLDRNNGPNCLHGGATGFHAQWWQIEPVPAHELREGEVALDLALTSPDGEGGFPGRLEVRVRYTLTAAQEWRIDYEARSDRTTVINLTQHSYFNLAGQGSALGHRLRIAAQRFLAVDPHLIPCAGAEVEGTPFDFRAPHRIGERLREGHEQMARAQGYDHTWVLDRDGCEPGALCPAAWLEDLHSGRRLEVLTTQPGLQFYSGNFLDGSLIGSGGQLYRQGDGVCLETHHFPDSPNQPQFPSTVLQPAEVWRSSTVYRFSA